MRQRGFTLVELIMVIVIMGVIAGMITVFMKSPIDAYFSTARRAAVTDMADTTVRRIARDLQRALPNSIRGNGSDCLEFIPTKTGGSYRTQGTGALIFDAAVTSFNMLGNNSSLPANQQIVKDDLIVIYNLGQNISDADAYWGNNYSAVTANPTGATETPIAINSKKFLLASGNNRFHVVSGTEQLVTYKCSGTNIHRTVTNALSTTMSCPATGPIIASNVVCSGTGASSFAYSGSDLQRNALISMVLTMQDDTQTETVTLQHEVHVNNTP